MASSPDFVQFVVDQLRDAGAITFRKMFGEYAVYCDGKVVALICDDQLFVKPTAAGLALTGDPVLEPPYPGAKPYLLIGDRVDDREWLGALVRRTAEALPPPKTKIPGRRGPARPGSKRR